MALLEPNLLTCSYVILNKPNLGASEELQFTPQFVATLFDLPQSTRISSTPDGLSIIAPGKHGPRLFSFNPIKIQIQNDDPFSLQQTAGRVISHFRKIGFPVDPTAYGLNYEFEFKIAGADSAVDWLARKFGLPGLPGLAKTSGARANVDSIDIRLENFGELQTLKLQPRAGKKDVFFAYTNLDFKSGKLLQSEHLEGESARCFDEAKLMLARLLEV